MVPICKKSVHQFNFRLSGFSLLAKHSVQWFSWAIKHLLLTKDSYCIAFRAYINALCRGVTAESTRKSPASHARCLQLVCEGSGLDRAADSALLGANCILTRQCRKVMQQQIVAQLRYSLVSVEESTTSDIRAILLAC